MRIRARINVVVLPLVVVPLFVMGLASAYTARNGISQVATDLLRFKAEQISRYAEGQWTLLEDNGLSGRPEFVEISKEAVRAFARSMVRGEAELIFAVDRTGSVAMASSPVAALPGEEAGLAALAAEGSAGWRQPRLGGVERVGQGLPVKAYDWYLLVTSTRASFYGATDRILLQGAAILAVSAALSIALLLAFSGSLTKPLRSVVEAMREITSSNDLSRRVAILQEDETGELGRSFNLMTGELERAIEQIKSYALESAIAKKREQKIRSIFQRYVPREVIDTIFQNPESALVGQNRDLAVMFSDIRNFTGISERLPPDRLVESLNSYFSAMIDIIAARGGIVDKFIGDEILAFFGAPVQRGDDALQSVLAGFEMLEALGAFNASQAAKDRPGFRIGVGINFGRAIVGNIGSEKKMDYTVIGDEVNLASRLEGLTKVYREDLVFSRSVYEAVGSSLPCRMLDRVAVKGRKGATDIYTARRALGPGEEEGWAHYARGLGRYYGRDFEGAGACFARALEALPGDAASSIFIERCAFWRDRPPGPSWTGVHVISEK